MHLNNTVTAKLEIAREYDCLAAGPSDRTADRPAPSRSVSKRAGFRSMPLASFSYWFIRSFVCLFISFVYSYLFTIFMLYLFLIIFFLDFLRASARKDFGGFFRFPFFLFLLKPITGYMRFIFLFYFMTLTLLLSLVPFSWRNVTKQLGTS